MSVAPDMSVGKTIGGQPAVFLVTVASATDEPVDISATADGADVSVEPSPLRPGVVGEVTVVPYVVEAETELAVDISAERSGARAVQQRTLSVMPGQDGLAAEAGLHLAPFIDWLAAERPELGISDETVWEGSPGGWVLVVNHYQYVSEDWELGLAWHVMIPPDDWARIYLRQRWVEPEPSLAFEISSFAEGSEPIETEPPKSVWR